MSKDKGIFEPAEGFAADQPSKSPFSVDETPNNPFAQEPAAKSPFSEAKSPFSVADDKPERLEPDAGDKGATPFGGGTEKKSPFSYDPPVAGFGGSPFGGSPAPAESTGSEAGKPAEPSSPFAVAGEPAGGAEGASSEPPKSEASSPFAGEPAKPAPVSPEPPPMGATTPAASSPAPAAAATPLGGAEPAPIRQLELRAIFGVDRELTEAEMLERSRRLSGIRQVARVSSEQLGAIEGVGKALETLGFAGVQVSITSANQPIEFIRDGKAVLAVQTDGSFAPGVRETLMIVARELARM